VIQIVPHLKVLVALEPVDTLFVFRNRSGTALKLLVYDSCGVPRYVKWLP
jgi:hypothetical protein